MSKVEPYMMKRHSTIQATSGQAELLVGTCYYACGHRFNWILDYVLQRTGPRSPSTHDCPKCTADSVCLICLHRFDAKAFDACQNCDCFFYESLLANRRNKLEQMGVRIAEHKATTFIRSRLEIFEAAHAHRRLLTRPRGQRAQLRGLVDPSARLAPPHSFRSIAVVPWVFPQAPTHKCASSPDAWPQWFDVWDVRDFAANEDLQAVGLREVVPAARRVLADEAALLGGQSRR
ncbi:hypothetical protein F4781DRAFT_436659 [Annulohypoxylon bovei var. microspora]|nr:hypothetical protein F4781DRAFT_436659 [Annulohypoxylon bovei var. microspora]